MTQYVVSLIIVLEAGIWEIYENNIHWKLEREKNWDVFLSNGQSKREVHS